VRNLLYPKSAIEFMIRRVPRIAKSLLFNNVSLCLVFKVKKVIGAIYSEIRNKNIPTRSAPFMPAYVSA